MNRGSTPRERASRQPQRRFNEAPIHESGKSSFAHVLVVKRLKLQ